MKHIKEFKLFESYVDMTAENYYSLVCKKAEHFFKEDNEWSKIKTYSDIEKLFDSEDGSIYNVWSDFKNRCTEIYKRDFSNYIYYNKSKIDSIKSLTNLIKKFPGFDNCSNNNYFNVVISKINLKINYVYSITSNLDDWFIENVEITDIFLVTFTNNVVKYIAGKIATILKKNPSKFKNFKNMEFAISDYIKDEILKSDKMNFFTAMDNFNL